jgi:hypothetical protein
MQARCEPCHAPGGTAPKVLETYDEVYADRTAMLVRVNGCIMPPADAGVLSDDEKRTILGWLVCQAPNN